MEWRKCNPLYSIPRFLSAGFIVSVCRVLLCLVGAFCCKAVRFGGWLLQSVGRLSASICFVLSM